MPFSPKIVGNPILPAIHGGMTGAFLETTAIVGVTRELGVSPPKPIELVDKLPGASVTPLNIFLDRLNHQLGSVVVL